ncbi:MAG: lactate racemase domain-containing protein, partial [Chloroflexota bacterium]|nr:lactate racemase domain-containing protein [Chloroflexota bacterium]
MSHNGNRGKTFYGGKEVEFDLPKGWQVLAMAEPKKASELSDIAGAVKKALRTPIGAKPLEKLIKPGQKVAIISEDQTRPSPVGKVVLPLLEELNQLGIPDSAVTILSGRGTHRPPTPEELASKLGTEVVKRVRVGIHDADDKANLVRMGTT